MEHFVGRCKRRWIVVVAIFPSPGVLFTIFTIGRSISRCCWCCSRWWWWWWWWCWLVMICTIHIVFPYVLFCPLQLVRCYQIIFSFEFEIDEIRQLIFYTAVSVVFVLLLLNRITLNKVNEWMNEWIILVVLVVIVAAAVVTVVSVVSVVVVKRNRMNFLYTYIECKKVRGEWWNQVAHQYYPNLWYTKQPKWRIIIIIKDKQENIDLKPFSPILHLLPKMYVLYK